MRERDALARGPLTPQLGPAHGYISLPTSSPLPVPQMGNGAGSPTLLQLHGHNTVMAYGFCGHLVAIFQR